MNSMNCMVQTRFPAVLAVIVLVALTIGLVGCEEDREVFYVYDYDALVNYINTQPVAMELFRTEGLFPEQPYSRPTDPGATYIEYVDSSFRGINASEVEEADFDAPFNGIDFTEVSVVDNFLIRTERSLGGTIDTSYDWRAVNRYGFFFRMGDTKHDYLGWVLHAFHGGIPRVGYMDGRAIDDMTDFFADGRDHSRLRYVTYEYANVFDTVSQQWVTILDTIAGYTNQVYLPLDSFPTISQGDQIVFTAGGIDGADNATGSVYQLMTAETDAGSVISVMHAPDEASYVDTLLTPTDNPREWNIVLFREFRQPDRWGATWVVPYRTGD